MSVNQLTHRYLVNHISSKPVQNGTLQHTFNPFLPAEMSMSGANPMPFRLRKNVSCHVVFPVATHGKIRSLGTGTDSM